MQQQPHDPQHYDGSYNQHQSYDAMYSSYEQPLQQDASFQEQDPYARQQQQQQNGPPPLPPGAYGDTGFDDPPLPGGYGSTMDPRFGPPPPQHDDASLFQDGADDGSTANLGASGTNDGGMDLTGFNKEYILKGLARLYRKKILPLEISSRYGHFHSPPLSPADFVAPPMVLLLGQYRYVRIESQLWVQPKSAASI